MEQSISSKVILSHKVNFKLDRLATEHKKVRSINSVTSGVEKSVKQWYFEQTFVNIWHQISRWHWKSPTGSATTFGLTTLNITAFILTG
jgi:hypothetical protein